jgi:hypothetical protein
MEPKEKREKMILIMGCAIVGISFGYLFMVTFLTLPATGIKHADTITGFLLGVGVTTILNYYWGSSSGSAEKSATIAEELTGTKPPIVEPPK